MARSLAVQIGVFAALATIGGGATGWWIWDGERRSRRELLHAAAATARAELAQAAGWERNFERALEACAQARRTTLHPPKVCQEAAEGKLTFDMYRRKVQAAYLEACLRCATPEECAVDIAVLRGGAGGSPAPVPCTD